MDTLPTSTELKGAFNAGMYFDILDKMNMYIHQRGWKSFVEFSQAAWEYSEKGDETSEEDENRIRYWVYSPGKNASKWEQFCQEGVMGIGWGEIGDLMQFENMEEIAEEIRNHYDLEKKLTNVRYGLWQFAHTMKPGDVVFVKKGRTEIVGRGEVESDYYYDENEPSDFNNKRKMKWTHKGSWMQDLVMPMKTLTDISDYNEYVNGLSELFDETGDDIGDEEIANVKGYDADKFLEDVYTIDEEMLSDILERLDTDKNIILQGPPGVGKTYAAKRLAYTAMGAKDKSRICQVQFHQSYSYEDFIEGLRPTNDGSRFRIRKGVFCNFCEDARSDPDNGHYFLIDEINRGNLSKIFGELFMLIEADKRKEKVQLPYSDEKFWVPDNVYIIGTMNTADRSLALLDYALRRRFTFFNLEPAFDTAGYRKYLVGTESRQLERLVSAVKKVNEMIAEDSSLGNGFKIGHSYLSELKSVEPKALAGIVKYKLLPLLKEYWFDNDQSYEEAERILWGALGDTNS